MRIEDGYSIGGHFGYEPFKKTALLSPKNISNYATKTNYPANKILSKMAGSGALLAAALPPTTMN